MDAAQFIQNYLGARPNVPGQLGADALANYAIADGRRVNTEMMADQNWLAGGLANQQFDQIGRVQGGFLYENNPYTRQAETATWNALGQAGLTSGLADRLGGMSGIMTDRGWQDYTAGPNALENQIFGAGMGAMGARADQIVAPQNIRNLQAAQSNAAQAGLVGTPSAASAQRVSEISRGATDVGAGALGQSLIADAARRMQSAGRLTPQEERDTAQATRAAFAARGLATSAPAAMTEVLNRDRFARARSLEDRAYAQEVQGNDIARQQNNAQRQLAALQGNQQVGAQMSLADQSAINQMRGMGYTGSINQNQFNAGNQQAVNLANMSALNQIGLANQSRDQALAGMSMDAQAANQAANMNQMQNNRGFMVNAANAFNQNQLGRMGQAGNLLGLGSGLLTDAGNLRNAAANINYMGARQTLENDPYARALTPGMQLGQFAAGQAGEMAGTNFANLLDLGANTYGFNTNMGMDLYNSWINNATAAQTGAQAANAQREAANISAAATRNAARQGPVQTVVGVVRDLFRSDERLKTDIKPIGSAGSVLGLTAYEFRYKGDKKKRKGFMAQDVQKVLPEAVQEFNHNGKKRLAIKPQVIGRALAEELAANAKAVAA